MSTLTSLRKLFNYSLVFVCCSSGFAQASIATRQEAHMTVALETGSDNINVMPIQAYQGVEIDADALDSEIEDILDSSNPDFDLTKLIRVLFYTDDYDDAILEVMGQFDMWITEGEEDYTYWSENHMIMWMSTNWLLYESYGWDADDELRNRLVKYLETKVDYGFYEFYSPTYFPYTLSGLLNLADFAEDSEIQELATEAAIGLVDMVADLVNEDGAFFPVAGRAYVNKYQSAYSQNHARLIYVLLGLGEEPSSASAISSFVTTTSVDFSSVESGWTSELDTVVSLGHSIEEGMEMNSDLEKIDRVMMQWSHGCYIHPDCVADTAWALDEYSLDEHSSFEAYADYIPSWSTAAAGLTTLAATFSRSSNLSSADVNIYKDGGVTLSSIDDYYGGYFGYQQFPVMASVGDVAVWTQSGNVEDWDERASDYLVNVDLPLMQQDGNLAIAMYWPNAEITLGDWFSDDLSTDVALYWPEDEMDQTATYENWSIGEVDGNYIAVLKPCDDETDGIPACSGSSGRQSWAFYVTTEDEVGSFEDFVEIVEAATYRESYTFDIWDFNLEYYFRVTINDQELNYTWVDD